MKGCIPSHLVMHLAIHPVTTKHCNNLNSDMFYLQFYMIPVVDTEACEWNGDGFSNTECTAP